MKLVQIKTKHGICYRILFNKNATFMLEYKTTGYYSSIRQTYFKTLREAVESFSIDDEHKSCVNTQKYKVIMSFNNINEVKMAFPVEFI